MTVATDIATFPQHPKPLRARAEVAVRWIVALVLLVAAALKADQIATEPMHGSGWRASRPLAILLVEYEAFLGFWLISGLYIRASRQFALATFLIFVGFAAFEGWQGSPSCNCFGKARVGPWLTVTLDLAIIAGLYTTTSSCLGSNAHVRLVLRFAVLITGLLLSLFGIATMVGFTPLALVHTNDLLPDTDLYYFGVFKTYDDLQFSHVFRIENRSSKPIRILGSQSSCRCTVAKIPNEPIPPGGYALVQVSADWRGRQGRQTERVRLNTDAATKSWVEVGVSADIVVSAVHWPDVVDFGDVAEGDSPVRRLVVSPGIGQKAFRVLSASCDDSAIELSEEKNESAQKKWGRTFLVS